MTNTITYEFNRYEGTPTMEITINGGTTAYLSPFRGYRFQVSESASGCGFISDSMLNTKMHELATISCGHAMLMRMAFDALERANADPVSKKSLNRLIDESIEWLIKNAEAIDRHNRVYQAGDVYHGKFRDLA